MKTAIKIALAFVFMVAFIESVIATVKWWRDETMLWWEWGLLGLLPVLLFVYFRYFSIFRCGGGQCLTPPDDAQR